MERSEFLKSFILILSLSQEKGKERKYSNKLDS